MSFPWEVNHLACEGIRKGIADRLDRSPSLVDKWCAPPAAFDGNGSLSPTQAFRDLVAAAIAVGGFERGRILLDYILASAGCLPAERIEDCTGATIAVLDIAKSTGEFSDYLASAGRALGDKMLSITELADLEDQLEDVVRESARQLQFVRDARQAEEARLLTQRIGPRRAAAAVVDLRTRASA